MSTVTKERLEWLANISGRDEIDEIDGEEIRELARIALASLEAEPVACPKCNDTGMADSGGVQPWGEPISVPCDCTAQPALAVDAEPVAWTSEEALVEVYCGETGMIGPQYMVGNIPLYLHAQHAPVVPDEMPLHTGPREFGRPQAYVDGWNACRDAMLHGADGNSPVIPDGYADMLRRWLAFGRGMQSAGSQLPRNLIAETEAMIAPAPQQEAE
ncbi:hypothetical protein [Citrobacter sedlakii]|uniref:hypothetical protein n=1 Tax=Citrobacter sedlakii TaxID=67826 RepID=UPI001981C05D|nr:hypothetical protein [Citrobacter sedlakii]MBN6599103.1 hypothetical protein [Citrobacter sedlakii]